MGTDAILIYHKDDLSLLEKFRPITLEPVSLKIFTLLLIASKQSSYVSN